MTKKQKKWLYRIIISILLLIVANLIPLNGVIRLLIFLIPYLVVGWDVLWKAIRNISKGQVFDENFLMAIATIGAFVLGDYSEGVLVLLFYQIGELFQNYAVGKSRKSITALMDIRPDYANIERDGELVQVDPDEVAVGDTIIVKPGEKIPLDSVVLEGFSAVNTSALTGESLPRDVKPGDDVISGCINQTGLLTLKVSKEFGESTVSKILDLVENSMQKKAKSENFITKFSRYYTPVVVISAVLLALIPPLFFGGVWSEWVERALIFLVISCPCALVISIPLSFFGGIGGASKMGILVKGSNYLEALSEAGIVVFDKTGTLTQGTFKVTALHPEKISESELLSYAALAESYSNHPISLSLQEAYGKPIDKSRIRDYTEISGHGVSAVVDGKVIHAGNGKLMKQIGADYHECHLVGTVVHLAIDGIYEGHIVIADEVKPQAKQALAALKAQKVRETIMLTGDSKAVAENIAKQIGIDKVSAELLPNDKVNEVDRLLSQKLPKEKLVFVGDGINDAPVLSRSDIGVAMGALGSDAAIEAADIVLMDDNPAKVATAIKISRKTLRIVKQNIIFAIGIKFLALILGAIGIANMGQAIFADVGVMILAVLNATRALNIKNIE
ncbi:heavy metal translocating P-type ATPase [Scatolibacter rhodanostii]|uniref:heavy metal translocating P-type ATPase n=1 Tax=Scatolibacter rhodanostii TaxID=2014781 RepID=UPI000C06DF7C|nr:heavy metal translocating P-type ATPase [Scatolibacter rhodanostii]